MRPLAYGWVSLVIMIYSIVRDNLIYFHCCAFWIFVNICYRAAYLLGRKLRYNIALKQVAVSSVVV